MIGDAADLWLRENDPHHITPADKARVTRETEWDLEALGEIIADGAHTVRQGGTWTQDSFVGFTGDADEGTCQIEVVDWTTPDDIVCLEEREAHHRRGVGRSRQKSKRFRANRRAKNTRWQKMQARKK